MIPNKKNLNIIFLTFLLSLFVFILPIKILAVDLEVSYPETIAGSTVTSSSGLGEYLKYVFEFGMSIGLAIAVITLTIAGILYFIAPASPSALEKSKDMISGAISGILILLLTYVIITTINPALSIFKTTPLKEVSIENTNSDVSASGVNFYKSSGCSDLVQTSTSGISDLGDYKNKISSVKIDQNVTADIYYVAILYDNTNYWGKCQYINPNSGCQAVDVSASSASVYEYNFYPNKSGSVTLYRKSLNGVPGKEDNKNGGYFKISQSSIGRIYKAKLDDLTFVSVPKDEQDCVNWSDAGACTKYQNPKVGGNNISSIKIDGDYIVLLLYVSPSETSGLAFSYCQAYPTKDDTNKEGPQQIKWDAIKNQGQNPNYIVILPIKK